MKPGGSVVIIACGILASLAAVPRSEARWGAALPQAAGGSPAPAKHSATANALETAFEPLARWRAAVLAGDKAALAALYSTAPPADTKAPEGESQDPNQEPEYWSEMKARGLSSFDVKILEIRRPRPDVAQVVLRFALTFHTSTGEVPYVNGASQAWVQQGNDWRIVATQRGNVAPKTARRLPEPAVPNTNLYPDPKEAQPEIDSALAAATKDHKRIILVFGGNWCYDCHVLDATFHSKAIAPLVNANYHVVHINIGDYDQNLDLADKYQVALKKGVPCLAVLDPDGKLVFSQQQGEFESTTKIGPEDVTKFLDQWKPKR
jgi:thioredoxin 1